MKSLSIKSITSSFREIGIQIFFSVIAITFVLRLWVFDWLTPFNYQGDTIYQLILAKSIAEGGWIWFIDRLSAPYFLAIGAFPQNLTISSVMMKFIALFTSETGLILNVFWLTSLLLTSVSCFIAMRSLGVNKYSNWMVSTLYALLPYTLIRNTNHICLTFIFVPILMAYVVEILGKSVNQNTSSNILNTQPLPKFIIFSALIAIGFDFIYNAFFSCFFLFIVGLMTWLQTRDLQIPKKMAFDIGLILICVLINLLPTFFIWYDIGRPPSYKSISDAETYGLKIRHMISSPLFNQLFSTYSNNNFPLENENTTAILGTVGAIGLIFSIFLGLLNSRKNNYILWSAGALSIWGILFGTIGGFGVIFNLLISPDIRAYNRISVFIAFLSFFTFAIIFDRLLLLIKERLTLFGTLKFFYAIKYSLLVIILVFGLYDQSRVVRPYLAMQTSYSDITMEERKFVQMIESLEPPVHQIYQLPNTPFPVDAGRNQMGPYDQGRPYLWSERLRWSWPSYSLQHQEWVKKIGEPTEPVFLINLIASGFDGLWVDRFGYSKTDLSNLESTLRNSLGTPTIESPQGRYHFYSLNSFSSNLKNNSAIENIPQKSTSLLIPTFALDFGLGFYPLEIIKNNQVIREHRWAQDKSTLKVINFTKGTQEVIFQVELAGDPDGSLKVITPDITTETTLLGGTKMLSIPLTLSPKSATLIKFEFIGKQIKSPNDPRSMFLSFSNPMVIHLSSTYKDQR